MSGKKKNKENPALSTTTNAITTPCSITCAHCGACYHPDINYGDQLLEATRISRELLEKSAADNTNFAQLKEAILDLQGTLKHLLQHLNLDKTIITPNCPTQKSTISTSPARQLQESATQGKPHQGIQPIIAHPISNDLETAPTKESWTTIVRKKPKKPTTTSAAATLRNFALTPQTNAPTLHSNITEWTQIVSTADEPTGLYLKMASKPYAPIKDWLFNGCQIPRQAIKDMCWYNNTTLELVTSTSLQPAVTAALLRAGAQALTTKINDPLKEQHRLVLMKGRTKSDLARSFYSAKLEALYEQNEDLPEITYNDLLLAKQQKQHKPWIKNHGIST